MERRIFKRKGFTLIELVIAIAVFLLFMEVFYFYIWSSTKFCRYGFEEVNTIQNARLFMDRIIKEMRLATNLTEISSAAVRFNADLGSGSQDIRYYFYDPSSDNIPPYYIYRAVNYTSLGDGQPVCVVLPDSNAPYPSATAGSWLRFTYYNSAGAETAVMTDVRMAAVYLMTENNQNYMGTFKAGTMSSPYKNTELRTKVYLRNANN